MKTDLQILLKLEKIYNRANSPFWWCYVWKRNTILRARDTSIYGVCRNDLLLSKLQAEAFCNRHFKQSTFSDWAKLTYHFTCIRKAIKEERRRQDDK